MKRFAALLDSLTFTHGRNAKLRLLEGYFADAPDPARGYALAALTGGLELRHAKPAMIRGLVAERVDPELFGWSYDFVGDLAETVALIWPERPAPGPPPSLDAVVEALRGAGRTEVPRLVEGWLDQCDASGRYALLKLVTRGLRVGVSARLAKTGLAGFGAVPLAEIEELWHGLEPPYRDLFAWLEGREGPPRIDERAAFRPLMLSTPLEDRALEHLSPADFAAEWKWDGIRVQLSASGGRRRIYSRTGDEISGTFPDVAKAMGFEAVLDGELLVAREGVPAPFGELQQRLNRKTVSRAMLERLPAFVRLYDMLFDGAEDLRGLPFELRRDRLEAWWGRVAPDRMDLSPLIPFTDWPELAAHRAGARATGIEGLMLKRRESTYLAGRPRGHWYKWKRDALLLDCVVMYAQRGHGRRSSYYSDYTFGLWRAAEDGCGEELVPVGKAYFGFTDEELALLDKWVRANTTDRFGPVRQVAVGLVFEVAFDSAQRSKRHKSGLAMRFPRISRIRWDKPAAEADRLAALKRMVENG